MEVTYPKGLPRERAREIIVELWHRLGAPPVDAQFLETVQATLVAELGHGAISPALAARLLADEGAELRHPGIIELDADWRDSFLQKRMERFTSVERLLSGQRLKIEDAEALTRDLEELRRQFEREGDVSGLDDLRRFVAEARQRAEVLGKNRKLAATVRAEQSEIAEWLKVWLQTPALFADWLGLRKSSADFRERFTATDSPPGHKDTKN